MMLTIKNTCSCIDTARLLIIFILNPKSLFCVTNSLGKMFPFHLIELILRLAQLLCCYCVHLAVRRVGEKRNRMIRCPAVIKYKHII